MTLDAEIELEGFAAGTDAATELGKAVTEYDALVAKLNAQFTDFEKLFDRLNQTVDKETAKVGKNSEAEKGKKQELDRKKQQEQQEAEEKRLKAQMSKMLGGGVNMIAYQAQLDKLKDQMSAIEQAEKKGLVTSGEASDALSKLSKQYSKLETEATAYAIVGGGNIGKMAAKATATLQSLPGAAQGAVKNQISGIGTGLMGLMSGLPIAGGLFGLMLYGVTNRDRLNADAGELSNIFLATGKRATSEAMGYFSSFQEQAQKYLGMSKADVQTVLNTFVSAGISIDQIMTKQQGNLGMVTHDIATLSLAIDKHFEMASGTSARNIVTLINDFGMEVAKAGSMYEKLAFAGIQSGVGVQNFVGQVMQSATALKQYGVSVESVAALFLKVQEHYESLGMPKQLAGNQASIAMGQITSGLANLSNGEQSYLGERMGLGSGLEARMRFREGMTRLTGGEGGSPDFLENLLREKYKATLEATGGDKTQARYILEQTGMGYEGAKLLSEIGDDLGKGLKLSALTKEQRDALKDSFMTEGQKQSELQKDQNRIMADMAKMGEGTLQVLTNLAGWLIIYFKEFPVLLMGTSQEKSEIKAVVAEFQQGMKTGLGTVWDGLKSLGADMEAALKPIIKPIFDALEFDPNKAAGVPTMATTMGDKAANADATTKAVAAPFMAWHTALDSGGAALQKHATGIANVLNRSGLIKDDPAHKGSTTQVVKKLGEWSQLGGQIDYDIAAGLGSQQARASQWAKDTTGSGVFSGDTTATARKKEEDDWAKRTTTVTVDVYPTSKQDQRPTTNTGQ
jgi:hypothetical protein